MVWTQVATRPFQPSEGGGPAAGQQGPGGQGLPAIAGHTVTQWQDTLVVLGGHGKVRGSTGCSTVRYDTVLFSFTSWALSP